MDQSKQKQIAGNYSTQVQAGVVNVTNIVGIDEARARGICQEEYSIVKKEMTTEAIAIAEERVRALEDRLMPKMVSFDESLKSFADPSFLLTLRKAQISAASSEREQDYDLLSELLVNRVAEDSDRGRRLGIVKAIEVVDQIDCDALIGLSMFYAVTKFLPISMCLSEGLVVLNRLYGMLLSERKLPEGISWMEHLDLLSAIRIKDSNLNHFKKMEEYIPDRLKQYFSKGILAESEEFEKLKEKFSRVSLNTNCFCPHPLRPGYMFLALPDDLERIRVDMRRGALIIHAPLSEEQRDVLREAKALAGENGSGDPELRKQFWEWWSAYDNLRYVREWWNSLSWSFEITPVGVALSNAYIRGKDPTIPCLY